MRLFVTRQKNNPQMRDGQIKSFLCLPFEYAAQYRRPLPFTYTTESIFYFPDVIRLTEKLNDRPFRPLGGKRGSQNFMSAQCPPYGISEPVSIDLPLDHNCRGRPVWQGVIVPLQEPDMFL